MHGNVFLFSCASINPQIAEALPGPHEPTAGCISGFAQLLTDVCVSTRFVALGYIRLRLSICVNPQLASTLCRTRKNLELPSFSRCASMNLSVKKHPHIRVCLSICANSQPASMYQQALSHRLAVHRMKIASILAWSPQSQYLSCSCRGIFPLLLRILFSFNAQIVCIVSYISENCPL